MFSTVDSPGARFLRIYLIRETEEIPVLVPRGMSRLSREVRTVPTRGRLQNLAARLGRETWVPYVLVSAAQRYEELTRSIMGGSAFSKQPGPYAPVEGYDIHDPMSTDRANFLDLQDLPLYRVLKKDEVVPDNVVEFDSVRVEIWRHRFDAEGYRLVAEKLREVTVPSDT